MPQFVSLFLFSWFIQYVGLAQSKWDMPEDIQEQWDQLDKLALNDPKKALEQADSKLKIAVKENDLEAEIMGRLTIANIHLRLEQIPIALKQIGQVIPIVQKTNYHRQLAILFSMKAEAFKTTQEFDKALDNIQAALNLFEKYGFRDDAGGCLIVYGQILFNQGDSAGALEKYTQAYDQFKVTDNKVKLASVLTSIASIYDRQKQYEEAISFYQEAISYLDPEKQKMYLSILTFNLGVVYTNKGDTQKADYNLNQAKALSEQLGDEVGIAYALSQLGRLNFEKEDFFQAEQHYQKALPIFEKTNDKGMTISCLLMLAKIQNTLKPSQPENAHLNRVLELAADSQSLDEKINVYRETSKIFAAKAQFQKAYEHQSIYLETLIKKHDQDKEKALNELQVKFEVKEKDAANQLLTQMNTTKELKLRYMVTLLSLSGIIVVMVIALLWRQNYKKRAFASLAKTDELTSAPNRRHILEYAKIQFKVAKKTGTPLTLGMMDLDHFKKINDQYGHDGGDQVLIAFYQAVKQSIRHVDRVGRIGGEEWLLVMPGVFLEQMDSIFERIRENLNQQNIKGLDPDQVVTFSMGIASLSNENDVNHLIKRADKAVYKAKQSGRDQLMAFS